MPFETYEPKVFSAEHERVISQARELCAGYAMQGYTITLRQLYYAFVGRAWIPNTQPSYKRLGSIVNDARLAGRLDWSWIEDRERNLAGTYHQEGGPAAVIAGLPYGYYLDHWEQQDRRIEVWVEKAALGNIVDRACRAWDVDWFACKGNVSQSEMWSAGKRLRSYVNHDQQVLILHLGDHDPNGLDMTRDIERRLRMYMRSDQIGLEVRRIALNMDQVQEMNLPPAPVKVTDSRSRGYIEQYGDEVWELDAIDPETLRLLIEEAIAAEVDQDEYDAVEAEQDRHRDQLTAVANRWSDIADLLDGE